MKCADCKFWLAGAEGSPFSEGTGECRRYAPPAQIDLGADDPARRMGFASWPLTLDDQFCGEFVSRQDRVAFV